MFHRKKKHNTPSDKEMAAEIEKTVEQRKQSERELKQARETVSVLNRIREENHIVIDLREVFGGH